MRAPGTPRDPYAMLSVPRGCSADEARRAFRAAARQVHPDVCDAPDAAQRFIDVKAAFDAIVKRQLSASPEGGSVAPPDAGGPSNFADIDEADFQAFVQMMQDAWAQSANEKRKRWQASEAWKEREHRKHLRSKGKRRAARSASVSAPENACGPRSSARKPNWRGGGRIAL
jgi:DnaJ-class molecular chaperone